MGWHRGVDIGGADQKRRGEGRTLVGSSYAERRYRGEVNGGVERRRVDALSRVPVRACRFRKGPTSTTVQLDHQQTIELFIGNLKGKASQGR